MRIAGLILLGRVLLDFVYFYVISDRWEFLGFTKEPDMGFEIISLFILFFFSLLIRPRNPRASDYFIVFLILGIMIPAGTMVALGGRSFYFYFMINISTMLVWLISRLPLLYIPTLRNGCELWIAISIICFLMAPFILIFNGGWSLLNFDFSRIYEFREAGKDLVSGPMAYLLVWGYKVFGVFLIVYSVHKRYFTLAVLFSFGQILIFGMTNHKALLFYPVLALLMLIVYERHLSVGVLIKGFCALIVGSFILLTVSNIESPTSWFVLRVLMMTSLNHFDFYEFISANQFTWFSNSVLARWIEYPYSEPIPNIIGFGRWREGAENFANTGFLASGYMHMGLSGMLFYSCIVGVIFWLIDSMLQHSRLAPVGFAMFSVPVYELMNADLGSLFLTHGMLVGMLGVWLLSKRNTYVRSL